MRSKKFQSVSVTLEGHSAPVEFHFYHKAANKIKHDLRQASDKLSISEHELRVAEGALKAAAIEKAIEEGTRRVRVAHVKQGWQQNLGVVAPDCWPMWKCLTRSVLRRQDELAARSRVFGELMSRRG